MLFAKTFKTFRVEVEEGVYLQGRMSIQANYPPYCSCMGIHKRM